MCSLARPRHDLPFAAGSGISAGESRFAADGRRFALGQPAIRDVVEADRTGRALCNPILMSGLRQVNRHRKTSIVGQHLELDYLKDMADCKLTGLMTLLSV